MEKKINIAELLKDCPSGMELDCASYDNVSFDKISDDKKATYPIFCYITDKEGNRSGISFTENGCESKRYGAKCVIFPKGKTTWEGFTPPCKFKDGDIIFTHADCLKVGVGNTWISIFKEKRNGGVATYVDYAENGSDYYSDLDGDKALLCMESDILRQRFATEKEKQKLFDAIKANGYKWNEESKSLEKLVEPKFKVGDKIRLKENRNYIYTITGIREKENKYECGVPFVLRFSEQDNWELVPSKFDINTLKPFDKVLIRLTNNCAWMPKFFSYYDTDPKVKYYPFVTIDNISYPQCIPYNGNEHLCRKTYDCDEFYKTWE